MDRLTISFTTLPGRVVVRLAGDLDFATSSRLAQLDALVGVRELVLDLHDVAFVDSDGVRALADLRGRMRAHGGRMLLAGADPGVAHLLARCSDGEPLDRCAAVPRGRFDRRAGAPRLAG